MKFPQAGVDYLELMTCWCHFLVLDNFYVLALDANVRQVLNDLVLDSDLVKLYGLGSWPRVIIIVRACWLSIFGLAVAFGV